MTERHKWADVLIARANGKVVQFQSINSEWLNGTEYTNPIYRHDLKWRIKHEPITVWVAIGSEYFEGVFHCSNAYLSKKDAEACMAEVEAYKEVVPLTYTPGEGL